MKYNELYLIEDGVKEKLKKRSKNLHYYSGLQMMDFQLQIFIQNVMEKVIQLL